MNFYDVDWDSELNDFTESEIEYLMLKCKRKLGAIRRKKG